MPKDVYDLYDDILCPNCKGHYREFKKLNLDNKIILFCNGCLNFWSDPKKINRGDNYNIFYYHLQQLVSLDLLEVVSSPWNNLLKNNPFYYLELRTNIIGDEYSDEDEEE
uniref:Uncharacterized protein n=1 Tax=Moumouvirus sp. 'Monve' TaxID=1128131 RepID=H2EFQ1_9VIRU|nr:hypothetical protein mv_R1114 [Moumouvirus Monve]